MNLSEFLKLCHGIYFYSLPKPIWTIVNPVFSPFIRLLRAHSYDKKFSNLNLIRLSGKGIGSGEPLYVTAFGNEFEADYYAKLFFETVDRKEIVSKKIPFSGLMPAIEKEKTNSNIVAVHASENRTEDFWKAGFFVVPDEVQQEMDVPKDFGLFESHMKKILREFPIFSELDRIGVERSANRDDLQLFIDKMYIPTIKKRFDATGFSYPREELEFYFDNGALFFITHRGVRKCGMILSPQKNKLNAIVIGALDGDESILRTGYLPVMYLEAMRYARAEKFRAINFGGSKTFIMDGVLRFKKKVGTKVLPSSTQPVINAFLVPPSKSLVAAYVFSRNPFIAIRRGKLHAVNIFVSPNPSLDDVQRAKKRSRISGLQKIVLIGPQFSAEAKKLCRSDKQTILLEEPDFFSFPGRLRDAL